MTRFFIVCIFIFLLLGPGCDGDGDGDGGETVVPAGDIGAEYEDMPRYVARGSTSVPTAGGSQILAEFTIGRPGTLEARASWDVGPALMSYVSLHHLATHTIDGEMGGASPIIFTMAVTQDLVDAGDDWTLAVGNLTGPDADVRYSVKFTPE